MKSSPGDVARSRSRNLLGGLLLLSLALYVNTMFNGFVSDDHLQVEQNPYIRSFKDAPQLLTNPVWFLVGKESLATYYRPVMSFGFLIGYKLFGLSPYGYHLMNVLLHMTVVWLIYAVTARLFRREEYGLLAGLVFALHPIHTEPVAWIDGVPDIEMTLFVLLAFLLFLRLEDRPLRRSAGIYAAMLGCFSLALLSKETAFALPLLLLIYEHFLREDRATTGWRTKLGRYGGFWVLAGGLVTYRAVFVAGLPTIVVQRPDVTWPYAILSGFALLASYIGKIAWPVPLSTFYPFQKSTSVTEPRVLAGMGIVLLGSLLAAYFWKRDRRYAFALLWTGLTLAPVLNARWIPWSVFAERYWYLPSVGVSWLVAGAIERGWQWRGPREGLRRWTIAVAGAVLALLAARAIVQRNGDWRSDNVLTEKTAALFPESSAMKVMLGQMRWAEGKREEAERLWREAIVERPNDAVCLWDLGLALLEKKNYAAAIENLQKAIALAPRHSIPHVYLGRTYMAMDRSAAAEQEFRKAVLLSPLSVEARNTLGRFYLDAGRAAEAESEFRASVAAAPTVAGWRGLAQIAALRNTPAEAEEPLRRLLELDPLDSPAHFQLGAICAASGRLGEAKKEYESGLWMDPANKEALEALRRILAKMGDSQR